MEILLIMSSHTHTHTHTHTPVPVQRYCHNCRPQVNFNTIHLTSLTPHGHAFLAKHGSMYIGSFSLIVSDRSINLQIWLPSLKIEIYNFDIVFKTNEPIVGKLSWNCLLSSLLNFFFNMSPRLQSLPSLLFFKYTLFLHFYWNQLQFRY